MEYYAVTERNWLWNDREKPEEACLLLSEWSQSENTTSCMILSLLEEAEQASQRRSVVTGASQVAFMVESLPASAGVVGSIPGQEGALEEGMATH